jgi:hypothetical protein
LSRQNLVASVARHLAQRGFDVLVGSKQLSRQGYIHTLYYTRVKCLHNDCNGRVWTSQAPSSHADCLADGRHERHMMRQRGAGHVTSALAVVLNCLYDYSVLDLFLQILASFSRLVLFRSPTLPQPSHHYPQTHHQLPLLIQTLNTYPHPRFLYTCQRQKERD